MATFFFCYSRWLCQKCQYKCSHSEIWVSILGPLEKAKQDCISNNADENIIEQACYYNFLQLYFGTKVERLELM